MTPFDKKKEALIAEFEELKTSGNVALGKKTSNLFRNRNEKAKKLDVRQFNQVLSIDVEHRIAVVEGMITYEDFVEKTLQYNLLPPVVPELKTITVGGAIVGLGIESSSFRYGLVHETVLEMQILTGDGKIVTCTPSNAYKDLFFAMPNSYGTLGYILQVTLELILAKKFVRLQNIRFHDPKNFFNSFQTQKADYLDGVIFQKDEMYLIVADFVDEAPTISNYTYMQPYFRSIPQKEEHYLTAHDYIWRWDADWFWCSKHFGMQNPFLRLLFGKFLLSSAKYWKIKHLIATNPIFHNLVKLFESPKESVIQDILIPVKQASLFYEFLFEKIQITPIWICPYTAHKSDQSFTLCPHLDPKTFYLDFGFWDMIPTDKPKGYYNQLIEKACDSLQGFKGLYSDSFYTEEEFWSMYPKNTYENLKDKFDPNRVFKSIYNKCIKTI